MITTENIVRHEMIGLKTTIIDSTNKQNIGLQGIIIDETKSIFIIDTKNGVKHIPKNENKWKFFIQNSDTILPGHLLEKRSYDRLGIKA